MRKLKHAFRYYREDGESREEYLESVVRDRFVEEFAEDFKNGDNSLDVQVNRYPGDEFNVIAWVSNKNKEMIDCAYELAGEFQAQGYRILIVVKQRGGKL